MAGSVNRVILVGNLGDNPDIRTMQSGDKVANLSIATSESWKDKSTGERKEKTEWHRIIVFNKGLLNVCEDYLKKGSKVYIEGQLETRSWEQDGQKKYTTEIVLRPYRSELVMLGSKRENQHAEQAVQPQDGGVGGDPSFDDQIPFMCKEDF